MKCLKSTIRLIKAYQIKVTGLVQGVGFRFYTKQEAEKLGVFGDVRNQEDGTVLINVVGEKDKITSFLKWCHVGPDSSRVDRLDYNEVELFMADGFLIVR